MIKEATITENIARFRDTKSLLSLAKAIALVLKQRRSAELIYGIYCGLFYPPSPVLNCDAGDFKKFLGSFGNCSSSPFYLSRSQLVNEYIDDFEVDSLPVDFAEARIESIALVNGSLIIGEYAGNSGRIAVVTPDSCCITDHYNHVPGVRHIHSVCKKGDLGEIYIATGDSSKLLDLWTIDGCKLEFVKTIKRRLAGYTAIVELNDNHYFGTDFSNRPNYIETLEGKKYFFPTKAYTKQAVAFFPLLERYIISVNTDVYPLGNRSTLSVFDTAEEEFVFCDYLDCLLKGDC